MCVCGMVSTHSPPPSLLPPFWGRVGEGNERRAYYVLPGTPLFPSSSWLTQLMGDVPFGTCSYRTRDLFPPRSEGPSPSELLTRLESRGTQPFGH